MIDVLDEEKKLETFYSDYSCVLENLQDITNVPKIIKGSFDCSHNKITSLEGGPEQVCLDYICSYNNLKNLKGAPEKIGRVFRCCDNHLVSLEGGPKIAKIFDCSWNSLTSLIGCPQEADYIYCQRNSELTDISDIPPMCISVHIECCYKVKKFPSDIKDTIRFYTTSSMVRNRIKKFKLYEIVEEQEDCLVVQIKKMGPLLLDSL